MQSIHLSNRLHILSNGKAKPQHGFKHAQFYIPQL